MDLMNLNGTEILLALGMIGTSIKWMMERRDKHSKLAQTLEENKRAMEESNKTVKSLQFTVSTKNEELLAKDRVIEQRDRSLAQRDQRIAHLETLLVRSGGLA